MARALAAFVAHLRLERGRSEHTVRAYRADLTGLLAGLRSLAGLDLGRLRGWLADAHAAGAARSTLARRAAAARSFTRWAHRCGLVPADPGIRLSAPRARRTLPTVLDHEQAAMVLDAAAADAVEDGPVLLRDLLVVELLYATGIRVAELCGLDLSDVDEERRTLRVFDGALAGGRCAGGPTSGARRSSGSGRRPRCCLACGAAASTRAWRAPWCTGSWRRFRTCPTSVRTDCDTPQRHTCSTAEPIFVTYRNSSVTLSCRRLSSTRTSPSSG